MDEIPGGCESLGAQELHFLENLGKRWVESTGWILILILVTFDLYLYYSNLPKPCSLDWLLPMPTMNFDS